ncbi:MAG TPA: fasciclin domain-containing protein [Chitinophagaceae bacterium]|nr:fasciclin domain-containing protein [Chitinophagaceae bacterium]
MQIILSAFNPFIHMPTILEIANADRNLSSLIKGLKATNLEETLSGIGPFTILAPVNLAFGNLNAPESFDNLVDQSKKNSRLSDILTFHVITGKKLVKDLRDGQKLPTVNGKEVAVTVKDGEVRINGAKILAKDRQGSNGVVHSIDAVYLPL